MMCFCFLFFLFSLFASCSPLLFLCVYSADLKMLSRKWFFTDVVAAPLEAVSCIPFEESEEYKSDRPSTSSRQPKVPLKLESRVCPVTLVIQPRKKFVLQLPRDTNVTDLYSHVKW